MQISWLGHSTFQFQLPPGEVVLIDPWTEDNPKYPAGHKISRLDAMLIRLTFGIPRRSAISGTGYETPKFPKVTLDEAGGSFEVS